jgi:hypothetical protein
MQVLKNTLRFNVAWIERVRLCYSPTEFDFVEHRLKYRPFVYDGHAALLCKEHHIQSVPRQLPDSHRWTSYVVITWTAGSRDVFRQFEVKHGFATQEQAERQGLTFAKDWIDNGKPKLRERGTGGS